MKKMVAALVIVCFLGVAIAAFAADAAKPAPTSFDKEQAVGTKASCIVDGKEITVAATTLKSVHNGKVYYFDSAACKTAFDAAPAKFVK